MGETENNFQESLCINYKYSKTTLTVGLTILPITVTVASPYQVIMYKRVKH